MLFNSIEFLIFFPIVLLIYFVIPQKAKNLWLLAASYYFYMCWNAKYVLLLLFSTLVTYIGGLCMETVKQSGCTPAHKTAYKKLIVAGSFVLNLLLLFYFKYINFALDVLGRLLGAVHIEMNVPAFDIILPVGISFYIFQALSYTMDVYRDEIYAEKNFFRYALFVSFFPQLVAGPIERSKNLLKQFSGHKKFDVAMARDGLLLMLWGCFLKLVIADRCAVLVNTVYGDFAAYHGFQIITANVLFAFQIYCDFMGYSIIATGAARVLGFRLMNNFEQPYLAQSVKQFWRRWHISLSSWLRDYLYIPLGGNRKGRLKKYRNLLITFLVSGLWHGANITFVIWGGLHGIYQICEELAAPYVDRWYKRFQIDTENFSWRCIRIVKTFILTDIAWVFFRADTPMAALRILKRSAELTNSGLLLTGGLYELGLDEKNIAILLIALAALLFSSLIKESGRDTLEWLRRQSIIFRFVLYWGAVILITLSLDITGQEFIYFQF